MPKRSGGSAAGPRLVGTAREHSHEMYELEGSELSAQVFGNRYYAPVLVAAAIIAAETGFFTVRTVARAVKISDSLARMAVRRAAAAGIFVTEPRSGGSRSAQFYSIATSDLANDVLALARTVCRTAAAPVPQRKGTGGRGGS